MDDVNASPRSFGTRVPKRNAGCLQRFVGNDSYILRSDKDQKPNQFNSESHGPSLILRLAWVSVKFCELASGGCAFFPAQGFKASWLFAKVFTSNIIISNINDVTNILHLRLSMWQIHCIPEWSKKPGNYTQPDDHMAIGNTSLAWTIFSWLNGIRGADRYFFCQWHSEFKSASAVTLTNGIPSCFLLVQVPAPKQSNILILMRIGEMIDEVHAPCVSLEVLMVTAFARRFGEFQSPKGNLCMQKLPSRRRHGSSFRWKAMGVQLIIYNMVFVMLALLIWRLEFLITFRWTYEQLQFGLYVRECFLPKLNKFMSNLVSLGIPTIPGLCFMFIVYFISHTAHMFHPQNYCNCNYPHLQVDWTK